MSKQIVKVNGTIVNLDTLAWYRVLKVFAWLLLGAAFLVPWFTNNDWTTDGTSLVLIGNVFDSLANLACWLIVVYLLRKLILYVVFGKQHPHPKRPFRPGESWPDFFKGLAVSFWPERSLLPLLTSLLTWGVKKSRPRDACRSAGNTAASSQ